MYQHYIYAYFSNLVYNDCRQQTLPSGWEVFNTSSVYDGKIQFYACAFINQQSKKALVAIRGTANWKNMVISDLSIALGQCPLIFKQYTQPFVEKTFAELNSKYPGVTFEKIFTGHSMGATLAELCTAKFHFPCITFDSPGSSPMIQDLIDDGTLQPDSMEYANQNVITYQVAPHVINTANPHVGELLRIYTDLDFNTGVYLTCVPTELSYFVSYTLQQHHMEPMLEQFDSKEMRPLIFGTNLTWPDQSFTASFNYWTNYDENPYFWDNALQQSIYPKCGMGTPFEAYKASYIKSVLQHNNNPSQQKGSMIEAPGNSNYPLLTVWGTTNGKNTLNFGQGNFKVIAYGMNTYKVIKDAKTTCNIQQMTVDETRSNRLFITDFLVSGYAIMGALNSGFLYLLDGTKVLYKREYKGASNGLDIYTIIFGFPPLMSTEGIDNDFPTLNFTNSPAGQFNIIPGNITYYDLDNFPFGESPAMTSEKTVYTIVSNEPKNPIAVFYKYNLQGQLIDKFLFPCDIDPAYEVSCGGSWVYERDRKINFWYEGVYNDLDHLGLSYSNLYHDKELVMTCSSNPQNPRFICFTINNFNVSYECVDVNYECPSSGNNTLGLYDLFKTDYKLSAVKGINFYLMEYSLISGYKLATLNDYRKPEIAGAYLQDSNGKQIHLLVPSPTGKGTPYNYYYPTAPLNNSDIILLGGVLAVNPPDPPTVNYYVFYLETSALKYFQPIETSMFKYLNLQPRNLLSLNRFNSRKLLSEQSYEERIYPTIYLTAPSYPVLAQAQTSDAYRNEPFFAFRGLNYLGSGLIELLSCRLSNQKEIVINKNSSYSNKDSSTTSFDAGAWDELPFPHPKKGAPVYIYRVFKENIEIGSAHFYNQPWVCRSEAEDRHNVEFYGVLADTKVDTQLVEDICQDICQSLPPTLLEQVTSSATRGAEHGVLRGTARVVEHALQKNGVSSAAASYARQAVYYGGYFAMRFWSNYTQTKGTEEIPAASALYQATVDTGTLMLTNKVLEKTCQTAQWAGQKASQTGWQRTGRFFKAVADYGAHTIYARDAYHHGVLETAASLAAGSITEKTVENIGKNAVSRFIN